MKYTAYPNYVRLTETELLDIYNKEAVDARDRKRAADAAKQAAREKKKKALAARKAGSTHKTGKAGSTQAAGAVRKTGSRSRGRKA